MKPAQERAIPPEVVSSARALETAGYKAFLVGGCVRDIFLGRVAKDWDLTTDATPEQIQALFPKTVYENAFGTVAVIHEETADPTVRAIEITPFRLESGYSDQRHPDSVRFSDTIEDDLKRRDFTVNALAASLSGEAIKDIIDLYGGINDIKDRTIKTVGNPDERFAEDALRLMRAIRLAVELDFSIEKATFEAISRESKSIQSVSIERIRDEFTKIILSPAPKKGLELLHETGILKYFLPELEQSVGVTQNQAHAYDVWEHLLRSLQHAADKDWSLEIRLAALFHDISKPKTRRVSRETGQPTFYNHELEGSRETRKILEKLRFSRVTIEKVVKLVRWHMFFSDTETITLSAVRRMIVNVGQDNIWDLMDLRVCDRIGTGRPKENPYRLRKYKAMIEEALRDPISVGMLKIDGNRIVEVCQAPAGPYVGHILYALFSEVLDDPKLNTAEHLEARARELFTLPALELAQLGHKGRDMKDTAEEKEVAKIKGKHFVS